MLDTGEDADLVKRVLFFLLCELLHLDFLERVDLVVCESTHLEDLRVGAVTCTPVSGIAYLLTQAFNDFKII